MDPPQQNEALRELTPAQIQDRWMNYMRSGHWEDAWRLSDEALRRRSAEAVRRPARPERHMQMIWDGTALEGKRVLIHCCHGMGDTVQFIRFVPMLRRIATRTIVWAQPALLPLLRTARGIDALLPLHDGEPDVDRDANIELMELPHALRATLDTLPRAVPYFEVGAESRRPGAPPVIGVVWQSGPWDRRRSIDPPLIAAMMHVQGIEWQILQRGPAIGSLPPGVGKIPEIHDILDEARALRRLDLLISVDTLSAHLGGALGVPTWTLLHADADWRWMEARDDTPWYPTMRLFRQRQQGNWQEVLERVTHALTDRLLADLCASRADGRCYEDPAAIAMPRRASAASPVPAGCKFVRR